MKKQFYAIAGKVLPGFITRRFSGLALHLDRDRFMQMAHQVAHAPNMELGLRRLAERGLKPEHVVDVGAFEGGWARMARRIWPAAQITMLEGNAHKRPILEPIAENIGATLHFAVLGPEDGREVVFHVMESGSSVLPENSPRARTQERMETRRLDSLLAGTSPDFLKLDVQGYELEVLKGAEAVLGSAKAVLMEVALIEINKGAPLLAQVVGFMKDRGFEVCDILEVHRRPLDKATNQIDLLFVPGTSPLLADTRHY